MTTPPGNGGNPWGDDEDRPGDRPEDRPDDNRGSGPSGPTPPPGAGGQGYPNYPSYPSTPHPEDNPSYGGYGGQGYQGYQGQQGYENYQGYQGYQGYGGAAGQPAQGTGKVTVTDAVGWAFRAVFANWPIWILGTLVLLILTFAVSALIEFAFGGPGSGGVYIIVQLLFVVASGLVTVFIYTGALREIDQPKIGLGAFVRDVNLWPSFIVLVLVQIFTGVVMVVIALPLIGPVFLGTPMELQTEADALEFAGRALGFAGLTMLVSVLLSPLTAFLAWYAVDRRAGVGGAIGTGLRNSLRNYGKLLLFFLLSLILIGLATIMTFGLAMLVLGPAMLLIQAHLYRQMAGGRLPVPAVR